MKKLSKLSLVVLLTLAVNLGASLTNKAAAFPNPFPHDVTGACIDGTQYSYHVGWFGRIIYENEYAC